MPQIDENLTEEKNKKVSNFRKLLLTKRFLRDILVTMNTALCGIFRTPANGDNPILKPTLIKENKMTDFITNAEKVNRSITLALPGVMETETLADLVALVNEDFCLNKVKGAMIIMLRSIIRGKLEAKVKDEKGNDTEDFVNSDKDILKAWDVKWIPELRVQKTAEEKALDTLQGLSPEEMQAVMAKYAAGQKEAK